MQSFTLLLALPVQGCHHVGGLAEALRGAAKHAKGAAGLQPVPPPCNHARNHWLPGTAAAATAASAATVVAAGPAKSSVASCNRCWECFMFGGLPCPQLAAAR